MLTNEKETMLNKVIQLENWFDGYLNRMDDETNKIASQGNFSRASEMSFISEGIRRNLNSIKSLINKS